MHRQTDAYSGNFSLPFITSGGIVLELPNMAIRVMEFSSGGYKIRKIFA
jgi:hypothetical protein